MTVRVGPAPLTAAEVVAVARGGEPIELTEESLTEMARSRAIVGPIEIDQFCDLGQRESCSLRLADEAEPARVVVAIMPARGRAARGRGQ